MNLKSILAIGFFSCSVFLTGCGGDATAEKYAAQLASVLKSYQDSIGTHTKAQQQSYENIAKLLEKYSEMDASGSLDSERAERQRLMLDQLLDGDPKRQLHVNGTNLKQALADYANLEFAANKQTITAEMDSYKRFLVGIQGLQQESDNINQFKTLLEDLSKKKTGMTSMKEAIAFGQTVKDSYNKLQCEAVKAEITTLTADSTAAATKLSAAKTEADKQSLTADNEAAKKKLDNAKLRQGKIDGCKE